MTFVWSLLHAIRSPGGSLLTALRQQSSHDLLQATFSETGRLYSNFSLTRRINIPQVVRGVHIPKGTFIACSPLVTSRDPNLFPEPEKFQPERWMTASHTFDNERVNHTKRTGSAVHFGKGQHACTGEKVGRMLIMDLLWGIVLGNDQHPGYDIEIVSGVCEGVGLDNVGVEPGWLTNNGGTPYEKSDPVMVKFKKRSF